MDSLLKFQTNIFRSVGYDFQRSLAQRINFDEQIIAIKGLRGVGKTTMLVQYMKSGNAGKSLYVTADHPWFYQHTLLDTAEMWSDQGGELFVIDEVHKYKGWSAEIKNIYDGFPNLKVIFTGSSALDIYRGEADLSRRVITYDLAGLSFREYLGINGILNFDIIDYKQLLINHEVLANDIIQKLPDVLVHFKRYLKLGYFPSGALTKTELSEQTFLQKLYQTIDATLAYDLSFIKDYSAVHQDRLKRLLGILAENVPFTPKTTELAANLQISRNTLLDFLESLDKAQLIMKIHKEGRGASALQKPDKVLMGNTNFSYCLSENPDIGTQRETFFVNQAQNAKLEVAVSPQADYLVNNKETFEIGGRSKKKNQIAGINNAYVLKDEIAVGYSNVIPLWLFGFLY